MVERLAPGGDLRLGISFSAGEPKINLRQRQIQARPVAVIQLLDLVVGVDSGRVQQRLYQRARQTRRQHGAENALALFE